MHKKFFVFVSLLIFALSVFICTETAFATENLKPLKVEQNLKKEYKYGNFDKTFTLNENTQKDNFSNILKKEDTRKEPTVFDVLKSLIFVILLILATGWAYMKFKKINPEQLLSGKFNKLGENTFKIISSLQLGAGKAIYLIEINDKQLIIGTTSSSVNLLAQMNKTDKTTEIPKECIDKMFAKKEENFKNLEE